MRSPLLSQRPKRSAESDSFRGSAAGSPAKPPRNPFGRTSAHTEGMMVKESTRNTSAVTASTSGNPGPAEIWKICSMCLAGVVGSIPKSSVNERCTPSFGSAKLNALYTSAQTGKPTTRTLTVAIASVARAVQATCRARRLASLSFSRYVVHRPSNPLDNAYT
jgi:hypothetical protein